MRNKLWKIALISFVVWILFAYAFMGWVLEVDTQRMHFLAIFTACAVSFACSFGYWMSEMSKQFWDHADQLEKLIMGTRSREELELRAQELLDLSSMALSKLHLFEVKRLGALLDSLNMKL